MTHPKKERSFVIIKPDGVQRSLVGDIISRFEKTGLKFIAMKMMLPTKEHLFKHYNKDDVWYESKGKVTLDAIIARGETPTKTATEYGKGIIEQLANFMSASPVIAMVLEGNKAVSVVKKIVGGTEPATSDVGTIRGDYTIDSYSLANFDSRAVRNLIHCSDSPEEAVREISLWFNPNELIGYRHINEGMLYDVNLDGILE